MSEIPAPYGLPESAHQAAVHESGHVIVAWELGLPVEYVTIEPHGDTAGQVWHTGYASRLLAEDAEYGEGNIVWRHLVCIVAGKVAENLLTDPPIL